jgi:hypothetical protein
MGFPQLGRFVERRSPAGGQRLDLFRIPVDVQLSLPQAVEGWQLPAAPAAPAPSALRRVAGRGVRAGRAVAAATTIRPAAPRPHPATLPA